MTKRARAPHLDDEQILDLYWARDSRAIHETDRKYGRFLWQVAYNILHNREDSEECQNDTYLNTWNAIPPKRPGALRAFLACLARHIAVNRYKEQHRQRRVPSELTVSLDELANGLHSEEHPAMELEAEELGRAIGDFVKALPERRRFIFLERYYFAHSVATVARELGLTRSAVYKELSAIREALRAELEGRELWI